MDRAENRTGTAKSFGKKSEKEFDIDRKRDDDLNVDYETLKGVAKQITKYSKIIALPYPISDSSFDWTYDGEIVLILKKENENEWNLPYLVW